jgi:hypothetical protein
LLVEVAEVVKLILAVFLAAAVVLVDLEQAQHFP